MPIPLVKASLTAVRYLLRPINNQLIQRFKLQKKNKDALGYRFFVWFGQGSNRFEIALNRIIIQQKGLGEIQKLADDIAFNKGVDWFTEVFFFYGVLFGIAFYEINKAVKNSAAQKARIANIQKNLEQSKLKIDIMKTDVDRVSTLQRNNRRNIIELESQVVKLEKILVEKQLLKEQANEKQLHISGK